MSRAARACIRLYVCCIVLQAVFGIVLLVERQLVFALCAGALMAWTTGGALGEYRSLAGDAPPPGDDRTTP
jgi:hypothetical protein